jgi:Na+/melibiose symporter-like transporter
VKAGSKRTREIRALFQRNATPIIRLTQVHAVSTAADACIAVSLAGSLFFSASVDAARPRLTLYLLLTLAPFAVVAPLIGPVTDRFGTAQSVFLAFSCQARAVLALFIAIDLRTLLLYPETFGVLVLGKAYAIAKRSLVASLVEPDELVPANARLSRVGSIAGAAGGSVAAGVLTLTGPSNVLRLAAIVHMVAAALALRVPRATRVAEASPEEPEAQDEATRAMPPAVRRARFTITALRAAAGVATFVVAFALKRSGAPTVLFGVVALTATLASLLGTFLSPLLRRAAPDERLPLALSSAIAVAGSLVAAAQDGRAGMVLAVTSVTLAGSMARHLFDSVLQRELSDAPRRRAFARSETVMQLAWVVGALVPTLFNVESRPGYLLIAAVCATGGSVLFVRLRAPGGMERPSAR